MLCINTRLYWSDRSEGSHRNRVGRKRISYGIFHAAAVRGIGRNFII